MDEDFQHNRVLAIFALWCSRTILPFANAENVQRLFDTTERYVDGSASVEELMRARLAASTDILTASAVIDTDAGQFAFRVGTAVLDTASAAIAAAADSCSTFVADVVRATVVAAAANPSTLNLTETECGTVALVLYRHDKLSKNPFMLALLDKSAPEVREAIMMSLDANEA